MIKEPPDSGFSDITMCRHFPIRNVDQSVRVLLSYDTLIIVVKAAKTIMSLIFNAFSLQSLLFLRTEVLLTLIITFFENYNQTNNCYVKSCLILVQPSQTFWRWRIICILYCYMSYPAEFIHYDLSAHKDFRYPEIK